MISAVDIAEQVASLKSAGMDGFDPVRFRYIESLVRRSLDHRVSVQKIIGSKARVALSQYQRDYDIARREAESLVSEFARVADDAKETSQNADAINRIEALFNSSDFRSVKSLAAKLNRQDNDLSLANLSNSITTSVPELDDELVDLPFDEVLRRQEGEVVALLKTAAANSDSELPNFFSGQGNGFTLGESTSIRLYRESWVKLNSDKLVVKSLKDAPEDPGPLNPQMLVTRSLSLMRELSPEYLSRYVSYIDTLLWLDQVGDSLAQDSPKKAGGKKPAGKAKGKSSKTRT